MIDRRRLFTTTAIALAVMTTAGGSSASTAGGTSIVNAASATYRLDDGTTVSTFSNSVVATVAAVSAVSVGTKEPGCDPAADGVVTGATVSKTFTVTNASNVTDAYILSAASTAGTIASLTVGGAPFTSGATATALPPGGTLTVVVTLSTTGVPVGSNVEISLSARSTATGAANGAATDVASRCAVIDAQAAIAGTSGAGSSVSKLVDGLSFETVKPGQTVVFAIGFENYGGVPAQNAVVTDVFPAGLHPVLSSVTIGGNPVPPGAATLAGQTLTVQAGTLAPLTPYSLGVDAVVDSALSLGTSAVNTATVAAGNSPPANSVGAGILVGTGNIVYDGYTGASLPVPGATVTLVDPATKAPIALAGTGLAPNTPNADPYVTAAGGAYSFGLGPKQLGPGTYDVTITAPGYRPRLIQIDLAPGSAPNLYTVELTALDGQPLALPGGFALGSGPQTLQSVYGLFGNLPLFRTQSLTITKSVDRSVASAGDRLVYTLRFSNVGTTLGSTDVVDTLPPGVVYAAGSGRIDGAPLEPQVSGRTLDWHFANLAAARTITLATVVAPSVHEESTLTNTATITSVPPNDPTQVLTASASADTRIVAGVFTDRTIVTGRVYADVAQSGRFTKGDVGLGGVRIFLEDGESVVTDLTGRYSFPGVRPGLHVLRLDTTTLPQGTRAYDDGAYDSERSTRRLLHGVFDSGIIQDVNFAIEDRS